MNSPKTGKPMREVENEPMPYTLRGEQFTVGGPAWQCIDTGKEYFTPEQGDVFMARLHHAWRQRQGIAKEALQQRGKALGLSDAQVSALLGFGVNQYRTYKTTDKLPSKSNARLLQMLCDDRALLALIEAAGPALKPATRSKLFTYAAQHQTVLLATAANLTTNTIGIAGMRSALGGMTAFASAQLKLIGDDSYATAA